MPTLNEKPLPRRAFSAYPGRRPVVFLHGRGEAPDRHVGAIVQQRCPPKKLFAPVMDDRLLSRPFAEQVADARRCLRTAKALIGHHWGAWLLLAAALEAEEAGEPIPPMLLLASPLGVGILPGDPPMGYIPPRSAKIMRALTGTGRAPMQARLVFVHGTQDPHVYLASAQTVAASGRTVRVVPAGFRLEGEEAEQVVRCEVENLLGELGI